MPVLERPRESGKPRGQDRDERARALFNTIKSRLCARNYAATRRIHGGSGAVVRRRCCVAHNPIIMLYRHYDCSFIETLVGIWPMP